jgi:hypothetical protein
VKLLVLSLVARFFSLASKLLPGVHSFVIITSLQTLAVGDESPPILLYVFEPSGGVVDAGFCGGSVMIIIEMDP